MTDKPISLADARIRRHYPLDVTDHDIVALVHVLDAITHEYLNNIRNVIMPMVERMPLDHEPPAYESFVNLVRASVTTELAGPLLHYLANRRDDW